MLALRGGRDDRGVWHDTVGAQYPQHDDGRRGTDITKVTKPASRHGIQNRASAALAALQVHDTIEKQPHFD